MNEAQTRAMIETKTQSPTPLTPDKRTGVLSGALVIIPDALSAQLRRMRRNPDEYSVLGMVKCSLGCKTKAYSLTHADSKRAGTWCAVHGWLSFESVKLPPTERLVKGEIADRQQAAKRKAAAANAASLRAARTVRMSV